MNLCTYVSQIHDKVVVAVGLMRSIDSFAPIHGLFSLSVLVAGAL
jgi:hypothetical protein